MSVTRSDALAIGRFLSEMRTNLALMKKSDRVSGAHLMRAHDESAQYLARKNLIYPPSMSLAGLRSGQSVEERKEALGIVDNYPAPEENELRFLDYLAVSQKKSLKATWIWRIGQAARDKALSNWFGFFITLTVDPSRCADSQAMWQENREFRRYLRRLARVACAACGQPRAIKDGASVSDYVHYVGVIEHGKSRHHHHMHLLLWMRDIPASWKVCPNRSIREPSARTVDWCRPMSTYWPLSLPGIGRAKFFRHEGDVWSRHGFVLPYDRKKRRVIRINPPEKAGLYVAKYMDKDDKVWLHRVKATRNLGTERLKSLLARMHWRKVEALSWRPRSWRLSILSQTTHTVPPGLLRSMAKQETFFRDLAAGRLEFRTLLRANFDGFKEMLKSVRDGVDPCRMRSAALYEWVSQHLPVPKGYCEARYSRALQSLGAEFPVTYYRQNEHLGVT